jgi:capsular exopolysaccharide synthesis family protein
VLRSQTKRWTRKQPNSGQISGRLVTVLDPKSAASEAYRTLRTNLIYAQVDAPPRVILVTSPRQAEGKSTICANLGVVLAQSGKSTLVIDCDFRRPVMHEVFGLHNTVGVAEVAIGACELQEAWQEPLPDVDLKVMTVGALPPNPAEFAASRRLSEILATLREKFDHILVDSAPMGHVSDPIVLATQVDGVLLTLDARNTRKASVQRAVHNLATVGANVIGTVMNNADIKDVYY